MGRRSAARLATTARHTILAVALTAVSGGPFMQGALAVDPLSPDRQRELFHLLKQDCGSCHGMSLKGGLGPALTAERVGKYSPEFIAATIRHGRPGTPMPPFGPLLSEAEIDWLVDTLLSGRAEQ